MTQIVSSISGLEIYAPSAGYAPLDSASVSSIASGYQVVSATGTQLYAGTAYLTEVNSTPISAERAGKAANASMANSAYYDGTGRLISALPDSAAVSSIASAYATAKQDASAMTAYAKSADVSGTVNTVANNAANWNGVYTTVYNNSASWSGSTGGSVTSPSGTIFVSGDKIEGTNSAVLTASSEPGFTVAFGTEGFIPSWTANELYTGTLPGSGATLYIPTNGYMENATAFISGKDSNMVIITASGAATETPITIYLGAMVSNISASSNTYITINGSVTAEKEDSITVTGIGELAWASSVSGVVNTVSSNSATWGQGGVDSATVSAIASSYAESAASGKADSSALTSYALSSDVSACIDTVSNNSASWGAGVSLPITGSVGTDSATYGETSVEFTRYDTAGEPDIRTASLSPDALEINYTVDENDYYSVHISENGIDFSDPDGYYSVTPYDITNWNSAFDTVSSNSATWGQGGVDSATVSAIASSYVESGVSSKADSSALSSYALSADVSGCIDTVSSNSATWGQGGAVTSPSGTIYVSGSTIEASNSAFDVKYTPDWSATVDTLHVFYPNNGVEIPVSGSGIFSVDIDSIGYSGIIEVYGMPDGVLIGSAEYEPITGVVDVAFPSGYTSISAQPNDYRNTLNNDIVTASGAGYTTTSVGTLAWETSIQAVANSSQATANGVLYILTGNA